MFLFLSFITDVIIDVVPTAQPTTRPGTDLTQPARLTPGEGGEGGEVRSHHGATEVSGYLSVCSG